MAGWESIFKKRGKVFLEPQEDMKKLVALLKKEKAKRVLDLGCGSGRHTVFLAQKGFEVYGVDVSKEGLRLTKEWLKERGLKAFLKEASCYEKFPFEDSFFDAVVSVQVIHHNYHDKVRFCISEIRRVLKPGGLIFVSFPSGKNVLRKLRWASRFTEVAPRTSIPLDGDEKGVLHFYYTRPLIKQDFGDFEILDLHKDGHSHYCVLARRKN